MAYINNLHRVKPTTNDALVTLLSNKADVNALNYYEQTYLHLCDDLSMIKTLIEQKSNINKRDNNGHTPLHIACKTSQYDKILLLLQYNADITLKNKYNQNIFHISNDGKCIDIIIKYYISNSNKHIPPVTDHDIYNNLKILVNVVDDKKTSYTPLFYAKDELYVSLLLQYNANPHYTTPNYHVPLFYNPYENGCFALLESGASLIPDKSIFDTRYPFQNRHDESFMSFFKALYRSETRWRDLYDQYKNTIGTISTNNRENITIQYNSSYISPIPTVSPSIIVSSPLPSHSSLLASSSLSFHTNLSYIYKLCINSLYNHNNTKYITTNTNTTSTSNNSHTNTTSTSYNNDTNTSATVDNNNIRFDNINNTANKHTNTTSTCNNNKTTSSNNNNTMSYNNTIINYNRQFIHICSYLLKQCDVGIISSSQETSCIDIHIILYKYILGYTHYIISQTLSYESMTSSSSTFSSSLPTTTVIPSHLQAQNQAPSSSLSSPAPLTRSQHPLLPPTIYPSQHSNDFPWFDLYKYHQCGGNWISRIHSTTPENAINQLTQYNLRILLGLLGPVTGNNQAIRAYAVSAAGSRQKIQRISIAPSLISIYIMHYSTYYKQKQKSRYNTISSSSSLSSSIASDIITDYTKNPRLFLDDIYTMIEYGIPTRDCDQNNSLIDIQLYNYQRIMSLIQDATPISDFPILYKNNKIDKRHHEEKQLESHNYRQQDCKYKYNSIGKSYQLHTDGNHIEIYSPIYTCNPIYYSDYGRDYNLYDMSDTTPISISTSTSSSSTSSLSMSSSLSSIPSSSSLTTTTTTTATTTTSPTLIINNPNNINLTNNINPPQTSTPITAPSSSTSTITVPSSTSSSSSPPHTIPVSIGITPPPPSGTYFKCTCRGFCMHKLGGPSAACIANNAIPLAQQQQQQQANPINVPSLLGFLHQKQTTPTPSSLTTPSPAPSLTLALVSPAPSLPSPAPPVPAPSISVPSPPPTTSSSAPSLPATSSTSSTSSITSRIKSYQPHNNDEPRNNDQEHNNDEKRGDIINDDQDDWSI